MLLVHLAFAVGLTLPASGSVVSSTVRAQPPRMADDEPFIFDVTFGKN